MYSDSRVPWKMLDPCITPHTLSCHEFQFPQDEPPIVTGVSLGVNEKSNTLVEISRKVCNSDKNKHVTSYETIMAKTNQWQLHNTNKHYGVHV